jgi:AcrR family transcriptional regulator
MRSAAQALELQPRKLPAQARSRATFEALVEACAGLLAERGYAATSTNHIAARAGVNVASLYEYFPGKDAIVAQVAERMVARVLAQLARGAERLQQASADAAMRLWIDWIHRTVSREKQLVAVFLYQVPFTNQLEPVEAVGARLLALSQQLRRQAGGFVQRDFSDATLHLVINLVSSTILQLVLDPPRDVTRRELLDELARRLEDWIRGPE